MYDVDDSVSSTDTTASKGTENDEDTDQSTPNKSAASPDFPYQNLHRRLRKLYENEDGDMWSTEDERNRKTRKVVAEFFDACQHRGLEHKDIIDQIEVLYEKEHYIPPKVYSWACEYFEEMKKGQESSATTSTECAKQDAPTPKEPLFSQQNLYHALLCCKALDSSDDQKVVAALGEEGHLFERLSVTKKECQKKHGQDCSHGTYLIAQKGDTYIVAFRGLPAIEEWKKMGKFHDGKLCSYYMQLSCIHADYIIQWRCKGT